MKCHHKIKDALERAFAAIEKAGLTSHILTWDGLWVPRHMNWDVQKPFSTHSWGIAFDLNRAWNGYNSTPTPAGKPGSVMELVPLFATEGFTWGEVWREPDGMHFQYGRE